MNDRLYRDVLCFIGRFSTDGYSVRRQVVDAFTTGGCYWFAYILCVRFAEYRPEIVFDDGAAHFAYRIDGLVYDITGDVTDGYDWQSWDEYDDETHKKQIIEQCIMF